MTITQNLNSDVDDYATNDVIYFERAKNIQLKTFSFVVLQCLVPKTFGRNLELGENTKKLNLMQYILLSYVHLRCSSKLTQCFHAFIDNDDQTNLNKI